MNCREILSLAVERRFVKDEIELYSYCFLDIRHLFRFKLAYSLAKEIGQVGNYTIFKLGNVIRVSPCYIAGVDDSTGKVFCMESRNCPNYYTEEEVRRAITFSHHHYESFEYKEGISIRLQGDLIMDVIKTGDKEDVLNFVTASQLENVEHWWVFNDNIRLLTDYVRYRLSKEEEIIMAQRLIGAHHELLGMARDGLSPKEVIEVIDLLRKVEREIKGLAKKYEISLEISTFRIEYRRGGGRELSAINVDDFRRKLIKAITIKRGDFKEFIEESERRLSLRLGDFTTPHEVKLFGVLISVLPNQTIEVATLLPQEIEVIHAEHGKNAFYIPKPSFVRFRLMGQIGFMPV